MMTLYRWKRRGEEPVVKGRGQWVGPDLGGSSIGTDRPYLRCCTMGRIMRYGDPE
jgi:hypothetical protein